jgi:putative ABC transport system permease protein
MNHLLLDLKDSCRALRRDLGYTATSVVVLALTIGATTATFSIVNGVLLKPLAYRESHQLVAIREVQLELVSRFPVLPVNGRHFEEWRRQAQMFEALAEFLPLSANLTGAGDPVQINLVRTSGELFDVLGVRPALGRPLRADDERRGAADVVVLGHAIWRDRFGADASIAGRAIVLDGRPHTVVGVLPASFQLPETPRLAGPVQLTARVDALVPLRLPEDLGWQGDYNHVALGRLKHGVMLEQARADLDVIQARVSRRISEEEHHTVTIRASIIPLAEAVIGTARRGLLLLLGAIAAVLLIATTNLANLSVTRAIGRLRDASIRSALGASRLRIVGQVLIEQLMVAAVGGALGMAVAAGALQTFVLTAPIDLPRVNEVAIDARALAFAALIASSPSMWRCRPVATTRQPIGLRRTIACSPPFAHCQASTRSRGHRGFRSPVWTGPISSPSTGTRVRSSSARSPTTGSSRRNSSRHCRFRFAAAARSPTAIVRRIDRRCRLWCRRPWRYARGRTRTRSASDSSAAAAKNRSKSSGSCLTRT